MSAVEVARRANLHAFGRSIREGDGWVVEADSVLNYSNRDLIRAVFLEYGECWLGRINGKKQPAMWKWDGESPIYNFSCSFVVPHDDEELRRLIVERDQAEYISASVDYGRISVIHARIAEIGGFHLIWA